MGSEGGISDRIVQEVLGGELLVGGVGERWGSSRGKLWEEEI